MSEDAGRLERTTRLLIAVVRRLNELGSTTVALQMMDGVLLCHCVKEVEADSLCEKIVARNRIESRTLN